MLKQIALAALSSIALGAIASTTNAFPIATGCDEWGCGGNGTQLTGITLPDESHSPTVSQIVLPSGETVAVR